MRRQQCQTFYKNEEGQEIQCKSTGFLRRVCSQSIFMCQPHLDAFLQIEYGAFNPTLKLKKENTLRLYKSIFGSSSLELKRGSFDPEREMAVRSCLRQLLWREQFILVKHLGLDGHLPLALEGVAKLMGLSRERVRQIEMKTLRKLRHPSRSGLLRDYIRDT